MLKNWREAWNALKESLQSDLQNSGATMTGPENKYTREHASGVLALMDSIERTAKPSAALIDLKLARANWYKYSADENETVYQANKMATAIDALIAEDSNPD